MLRTWEKLCVFISNHLPKLTLRRALTIPIGYALVFGLFRAVHGPPTPDVVVCGLIGGTGLAGIVLLARTPGQWLGAIAGLIGGVFVGLFCFLLFAGGSVDGLFMAMLIGVAVTIAVRQAVDGPRPRAPETGMPPPAIEEIIREDEHDVEE
ncbi:MAG TPA: hypothetical protein VG406_04945 [Isosphaeraceae bacterium]|jgi:Na+/proline symporter|nr:hypothetical protein [Isosphaeraceae bacterium]